MIQMTAVKAIKWYVLLKIALPTQISRLRICITLFHLSVIMLLFGCSSLPGDKYTVAGIIIRDGYASENEIIKFISKRNKLGCSAEGLQSTTDENGYFRVSSSYYPAYNEKHRLVTHPFKLCKETENGWVELWKLTTGPFPKSVGFRCSYGSSSPYSCLVAWNKRNIPY